MVVSECEDFLAFSTLDTTLLTLPVYFIFLSLLENHVTLAPIYETSDKDPRLFIQQTS